MKYSINFKGYWPVGAVAVVEAGDFHEAVQKLYHHKSFEPHRAYNCISDMEDNTTALVKEVEILLDGNY